MKLQNLNKGKCKGDILNLWQLLRQSISNLTQNVQNYVLHIFNYLKNLVGMQTDMCDMA